MIIADLKWMKKICGLGMFPDLRDNSNDFSVVGPLSIVTSGWTGPLLPSSTVKPSEAYSSGLHWWIDYLNIEPANRFKNAIMNWLLENWTHYSFQEYG